MGVSVQRSSNAVGTFGTFIGASLVREDIANIDGIAVVEIGVLTDTIDSAVGSRVGAGWTYAAIAGPAARSAA